MTEEASGNTPRSVTETASSGRPGPRSSGTVVLDIGGDVGALVVYTPASWHGTEIEVEEQSVTCPRTHTGVRERSSGRRSVTAAVFPELAAGRYELFDPAGRSVAVAAVAGGEVAEIDVIDLAPERFEHLTAHCALDRPDALRGRSRRGRR